MQERRKKSLTAPPPSVILVPREKYVCREPVAHQHLHRRGKLKLAKQIRCQCAENAIFHPYPQLISKGGEKGIFKDRIKRVNKCWEAGAEEGMCVSEELGGQ